MRFFGFILCIVALISLPILLCLIYYDIDDYLKQKAVAITEDIRKIRLGEEVDAWLDIKGMYSAEVRYLERYFFPFVVIWIALVTGTVLLWLSSKADKKR